MLGIRKSEVKAAANFILPVALLCTAMYGSWHFLMDTPEISPEQRFENLYGKRYTQQEDRPTYQDTQNDRVSNLNALLAKIDNGQTSKEDLVLQVKSKPVPHVTPEVLDHLQDCRDKFKSSSPGMVLECMKTTEAQEVAKESRIKRVVGTLTAAFAAVALVGLGIRRSRQRKAGREEMREKLENMSGKNGGAVTKNTQAAPKQS